MEITSVRIYKKEKEGSNLKAIASAVIDGCFVVHGIRVIEKDGNLFLAMPNRKVGDGEFKDVAHPLDKETRKLFEDKVLEAYKEELAHPTVKYNEPVEENPSSEE